ncbi:MAG: hypothetical protein ACRD15_06265, partial [Vicinamibacterales bacterium]
MRPGPRTTTAILACAGALWLGAGSARMALPHFYSDDPIWRDPETQDASKAQAVDVSDQFDLIENSFLGAGEQVDQRALNVNTVDEVPDSSWFSNRVGPRSPVPHDTADLMKGPHTGAAAGPAAGTWTITGRKSEGVTPGFTIRDSIGEIDWIKFDPAGFPEMASGAEVI